MVKTATGCEHRASESFNFLLWQVFPVSSFSNQWRVRIAVPGPGCVVYVERSYAFEDTVLTHTQCEMPDDWRRRFGCEEHEKKKGRWSWNTASHLMETRLLKEASVITGPRTTWFYLGERYGMINLYVRSSSQSWWHGALIVYLPYNEVYNVM